MSTACKLSPMVREQRRARADLVKETRQVGLKMLKEHGMAHQSTLMICTAADLLLTIHRDPTRPGWLKQGLFVTVAREIEGLPA